MIICKHGFWLDSEGDCRRLHTRMPGGSPVMQALFAIVIGCLVATIFALVGY